MTARAGAPLVLSLALVVAAHVAVAHAQVPGDALAGTDGYMRLVRVERWVDGAGWYDATIPRSGPPHGTTLHWTRPFDVVLRAGAVLASPWTEGRRALLAAGRWVSPVLHLLACLAFAWAIAPFVPRAGRFLAVLAWLLLPGVFVYSTAGRADHHALVLLLGVVALGCHLRLPRPGWAAGAGVALGVALWVSPEVLPLLLALHAAGAVLWVRAPEGRARAHRDAALALLATLAVALVAERAPSARAAVEYDRVSVAHLALAAALALGWAVLARVRRRRAAVLPLVALPLVAALLAAFPGLAGNPLVDAPPRAVALWLGRIAELRPLLPTDARRAGLALVHLGPPLLALGWLLGRVRRDPRNDARVRLLVALVVLLPFGVAHLRSVVFAQAVAAVALVDACGHLLPRARHAVAQAAVAALLLAGPQAAGLLWSGAAAEGAPLRARVDLAGLARELAREPDARVVAAHVDFGAELLWRTPHAFVATPYHRNVDGFLDTVDLFAATDDGAARRLAARRGIDWLLIAPGHDDALFDRPFPPGPTLYRRLRAGDPPPWLRAVELPGAVGEAFSLYEVARR